MKKTAIAKIEYGNPEKAYLFEDGTGTVNKGIAMSQEDVAAHTKVYCHANYAQELFNAYMDRAGKNSFVPKDVAVGDSVRVRAVAYSEHSKTVRCETVGSGAHVTVPMSEFIFDVDKVTQDEEFDVVVTRADNGSYMGTCKNPHKYKEELEEARINNTWFDVKVISLIRGGYRAVYKGTIECFIPGSHAAANIVVDFNELIGKTIPVMVDNYDWSSRMYVVSYKKYVRESLPEQIHNIKFGHKYTGRLTSNPTEFGLFIEFENYYTGLAHRVDFSNYEEICRQYKAGDKIDVYVKNITEKKGNYRIVLTTNEADIDKCKMTWYRFKNACEGKVLGYVYNPESMNISVKIDETESITIALPRDFNVESLNTYDRISIKDVNVLRLEIKFDFCK